MEAQKRAAERYRYVVANGWEAAEKNPEFRVQPPEPDVKVLTVGSWISDVRAIALVAPVTFLSYEQALRRVAAEAVLGLTHSGKLHEKWLSKVDSVPLDKLSNEVVAKWIRTRLTNAGSDPRNQEKAKHTINHILRSAKAMFSKKKVLKNLSTNTISRLPSVIPLVDVGLLGEDSSARFTPSVDPEQLFLRAQKELGGQRLDGESESEFHIREQQWIALILSFCGGLRRKESDLLEWQQIQFDHPKGPRITLTKTKHFRAKNNAHETSIPLDLEVSAILEDYRRKFSGSSFVLQSDREVIASGIGKPRCHRTWKALMTWLRTNGVDDIKPIHSLRKSIGSYMAHKHGLHAAQRHLRHTSPTITSKFYSNREAIEVPGVGALLAAKPN